MVVFKCNQILSIDLYNPSLREDFFLVKVSTKVSPIHSVIFCFIQEELIICRCVGLSTMGMISEGVFKNVFLLLKANSRLEALMKGIIIITH